MLETLRVTEVDDEESKVVIVEADTVVEGSLTVCEELRELDGSRLRIWELDGSVLRIWDDMLVLAELQRGGVMVSPTRCY